MSSYAAHLDIPDRCSVCPAAWDPVPADGPPDARVLLIGERPGIYENRVKIPFIGQSGEELTNTYLPRSGLSRSRIRVCNSVWCFKDQNPTPTDEEIKGCASFHVARELEETDPEVVILAGAVPCKLATPAITLAVQHGIPFWGQIFDWDGWIIPINHPAAGLHDTGMMIPMLDDWAGLRKWLKTGDWTWPEDPYAGREDYGVLRSVRDLNRYVDQCYQRVTGKGGRFRIIGADTESHGPEAYSYQLSLAPGTARLVPLSAFPGERDPEVAREAGRVLRLIHDREDAVFSYHQAGADLDIADELLGLAGCRYRDTMQEAYHLGNQPQSLKALCFRLLGMEMRSWGELVLPHSKQKVWDWMYEGLEFATEHLRTTERVFSEKRFNKDGTPKENKPKIHKSPVETPLNRTMSYTAGGSEKYDPWEKLENLFDNEDTRDHMENLTLHLGSWPDKGIANVPLDEATHYACRDADGELRIAYRLEELREEMGNLRVVGEDRDRIAVG